MGETSAKPVTVLNRKFESLDQCCQTYGIFRSTHLKQAKQLSKKLGRKVDHVQLIIQEAEKRQEFMNMAQDFALGKYTRKIEPIMTKNDELKDKSKKTTNKPKQKTTRELKADKIKMLHEKRIYRNTQIAHITKCQLSFVNEVLSGEV